MGAQVAQALASIHRAGFVYRDVKPENILRCSERNQSVYRLIDFGSATGIDGCPFGAKSLRSTRGGGSASGDAAVSAFGDLGDDYYGEEVYSDVERESETSSDDAYRCVCGRGMGARGWVAQGLAPPAGVNCALQFVQAKL